METNKPMNVTLNVLFQGIVQTLDFSKIDTENLDKHIDHLKRIIPEFIGIEMKIVHLTVGITNKRIVYGVELPNGEKVFGSVTQVISFDEYNNALSAGSILSSVFEKDNESTDDLSYNINIVSLKQRPNKVGYTATDIIQNEMRNVADKMKAIVSVDNVTKEDWMREDGIKTLMKMLEMATSAQLIVLTHNDNIERNVK